MTERSFSLRAAAAGWALCAGASLAVAVIMYRGEGVFSDRYANQSLAGASSALVLWCVVPDALATVALLGIWLRPGGVFVFPPLGALGALTLLAAFSFGFLFAPGALVLLAASILDRCSDRGGWRVTVSVLWLVVGATGLLPTLSAITKIHTAISGEAAAAGPTGIAVFVGSVAFVATCELLHALYVRRAEQGRSAG